MAFSRSLMGNKKIMKKTTLGLILFSFLHQSCSHYKITVIWFCNSVLYWSCNRNTVKLKQLIGQEDYVISKFRQKKPQTNKTNQTKKPLRQPGIRKFAEQCRDWNSEENVCIKLLAGRVWNLRVNSAGSCTAESHERAGTRSQQSIPHGLH